MSRLETSLFSDIFLRASQPKLLTSENVASEVVKGNIELF